MPAFRRDVAIEDDLVEEVARVWGYEKVPSTLPSGTLTLTRRPRPMVARDIVRRVLTGAGFQEAVSLSLIDPAHLRHLERSPDDPRVVRLQNPLATDRSVLRPTLLFGLLEALATNVRRQTPDVRLFEIGRVFEGRGAGSLPREETRVGLVLTGLRAPRAWHAPRARGGRLRREGRRRGARRGARAGRGQRRARRRRRTSRTVAPPRSSSRARPWGRWASSTPTCRRPSTCPRRSSSPRCRSTRSRPCRAAWSSTGRFPGTRASSGTWPWSFRPKWPRPR